MYVALREAMNAHGLKVREDEMDPWHGAQKSAGACDTTECILQSHLSKLCIFACVLQQ